MSQNAQNRAGEHERMDLHDRLGVEPDALKTHVRQFYTALNAYLVGGELDPFVQFFNWGYAPVPGRRDDRPDFVPTTAIDRLSVRLVMELLGDTPIDGADVLDVGCGRGGTIATLGKQFSPASLTGIDITPMSIAHCLRTNTDPRARFFEGDAEALAFGDEIFDVVTNLESSNAYPHIDRFYGEVNRVLRTGGVFCYTDLLRPDQFDHARRFLAANGFALEHDRDITANVLAARRMTADTQLRAFNADGGTESSEGKLLDYFLAPESSAFFASILAGDFEYRILRWRKVAAMSEF